MLIVTLHKDTVIARESGFVYQAGESIMTGVELPCPAGDLLGIRSGTPVKAMYHQSSETYGFTWHGERYRAMDKLAGAPPVQALSLESDHWHTCKYCRDGLWCDLGMGIILDAAESEAAQ